MRLFLLVTIYVAMVLVALAGWLYPRYRRAGEPEMMRAMECGGHRQGHAGN